LLSLSLALSSLSYLFASSDVIAHSTVSYWLPSSACCLAAQKCLAYCSYWPPLPHPMIMPASLPYLIDAPLASFFIFGGKVSEISLMFPT